MDCGMADMRNATSLSCPETAWNSPSVFSAPSTRDAFACCWTLNQLHYNGYQRKKVCMRGDTIDDFYSLSNLSKKLFKQNVDSFQTVDPYIRRRLVKDHLHSIRQFGVFLKMRMKSFLRFALLRIFCLIAAGDGGNGTRRGYGKFLQAGVDNFREKFYRGSLMYWNVLLLGGPSL